jgi:predicted TIM-barrel fold metal-dependent hydrolase
VDEPLTRASEELLLADFRPRSQLRARHAGAPARPSVAAIDAHSHLGPTPFSGGWERRTPAELAATLDASNIAAIVDLDGAWGDALRRELEHWAPLDDRVAVFAGLDYATWATRPDFGEVEAARLRDAAAAGARGLKVWKLLGLRARDAGGRLVPVDDPRLDPLWAAAGTLRLPVTIHVADPIAFFEPLDATNERYEELRAHPDWHFWPTRGRGRPDEAGFPPFDELIDGLEAVVARHPGTTFIGAHVGCAAEDLGRVDRMLAAYPNFHVDLAARIAELGRQPYSARELIVRWPDRVLFGTDAPPDPAAWAVYARFLETRDESFDYEPDGGLGSQGRWQIHGLGLAEDVLQAVYADNAMRLVFGRAGRDLDRTGRVGHGQEGVPRVGVGAVSTDPA